MDSTSLYDAVAPFPTPFNLCDYYLDRNLREGRGGKVALICGGERRTYAQVAERVARLAAALRRAKLRPEERVLIVLPDGFEFAETWFATLRAGGVFAMVNPLMKREQFEYYLEYTKARIVVTHSEVLPEIGDAARASRLVETVLVVGPDAGGFEPYEEALNAERADSPAARSEPTSPDDLAGWLFTSGSTGHPKACVHTHADFAYNTETYALRVAGYRESDVCLSVPKLFFGYATGTNLMFPFRVGATTVLFPGRATADELLDQISAHRPTFLTGVPTMFNNLLRSERIASADLSSLRVALSAGEALPAQLYSDWKARTGVEILDGIGSAEMFHIYISNYPGDVVPGSLGRLVPGYEARIVGPDGQDVPPGEAGTLWVKGESAAILYWQAHEKSKETLRGDWVVTGDHMRQDGRGYFWYEGRTDEMLKVGGIFVSPYEVENCLLQHPVVAECAVIGYKDPDGLTKPKAYVVPRDRPGDDVLARELQEFVKTRLAPFKYPRVVEFTLSLPKNDRGKIDRRRLAAS